MIWILAPDSAGSCCECQSGPCDACFPRCGHAEDEVGLSRPRISGPDVYLTTYSSVYCRWSWTDGSTDYYVRRGNFPVGCSTDWTDGAWLLAYVTSSLSTCSATYTIRLAVGQDEDQLTPDGEYLSDGAPSDSCTTYDLGPPECGIPPLFATTTIVQPWEDQVITLEVPPP